jgi:hypothetical protein
LPCAQHGKELQVFKTLLTIKESMMNEELLYSSITLVRIAKKLHLSHWTRTSAVMNVPWFIEQVKRRLNAPVSSLMWNVKLLSLLITGSALALALLYQP